MTVFAHMFKNFSHGSSQWIEITFRFRTLFWRIRVWILILVLKRTLVLILVQLNYIDVGLNIRCLAWTFESLLSGHKDPSLSFFKLSIVYNVFNSHSAIAKLLEIHDRWCKHFIVINRQKSFHDYIDLVLLIWPIYHLRGLGSPSHE